MVQLFSTRSYLSYACLLLIVNIILFMFYPIVREVSKENSERLDRVYIRSYWINTLNSVERTENETIAF